VAFLFVGGCLAAAATYLHCVTVRSARLWLDSSFFSFTNGGITTSSWNQSTSTITAIPEPSTYIAALGLLALCVSPLLRRLIKEAKSILGLRAPLRDRLAGKA